MAMLSGKGADASVPYNVQIKPPSTIHPYRAPAKKMDQQSLAPDQDTAARKRYAATEYASQVITCSTKESSGRQTVQKSLSENTKRM